MDEALGGATDPVHDRHDDRAAARVRGRRSDRRARRLLLVRHERPDADHVRPVARRCRPVPAGVHRRRRAPGRPVRGPRPGWGRRADRARRARRPGDQARASRSGSAASTAASRARSSSATGRGSTTCRARRSGCRSPGSRRPGPRLLGTSRDPRQIDRTLQATVSGTRAVEAPYPWALPASAVLLSGLPLQRRAAPPLRGSPARPRTSCSSRPARPSRPTTRFLFVANANSELRYDSGTIDVIDLDLVDQVANDVGRRPATPRAGCCRPDPDHQRDRSIRATRRSSSSPARARASATSRPTSRSRTPATARCA